ncbi:HD-GYP domain-containing protein [Variovorax sp. HJSM1_2]|uniref:HD-GYP domain-containing protein n=1 Tax=Variovorax sp. HJSM1_2 TaxID=3366263 RepID=UPI003BE019B3
MDVHQSVWIDIGQLRRGMYIQLDLGWMEHPFPKGSFKIASHEQIGAIRSLGLSRLRYYPGQSDPASESDFAALQEQLPPGMTVAPDEAPASIGAEVPEPAIAAAATPTVTRMQEVEWLRSQRREQLANQQRSLERCERKFGEAMVRFRRLAAAVGEQPKSAADQAAELVQSCVAEVLGAGDSAIRLLSETMGDRSSEHPVNVMVVSLLLGKALALPATELQSLGMAAVLHDIGKTQVPERLRAMDEKFSASERIGYREHVAFGVALGKRMGLAPEVLLGMAQHHELVDGSGFPQGLRGEQMSQAGKILALVNLYDNLCNPARLVNAITPHEALSMIFAQMKSRFDTATLGAFIRLMGVYPPGSVVQLVNDAYGVVVSVNSARPLKPRVILHDQNVPRAEALIVDLEQRPDLGIRRSLKPAQLSASVREYLALRPRVCYYVERSGGLDRLGSQA